VPAYRPVMVPGPISAAPTWCATRTAGSTSWRTT
jgi:hypothetical protein